MRNIFYWQCNFSIEGVIEENKPAVLEKLKIAVKNYHYLSHCRLPGFQFYKMQNMAMRKVSGKK